MILVLRCIVCCLQFNVVCHMKVKRAFTRTFWWVKSHVFMCWCVGGNKNGIIIVVIIIKGFECFQAHDGANPIPLNATAATMNALKLSIKPPGNRFGDYQIAGTSWTTIISGVNKNGLCFHSHLVVTVYLYRALVVTMLLLLFISRGTARL